MTRKEIPRYAVFDGRFWWKNQDDIFDTCFRCFEDNYKEALETAKDVGIDAVICKVKNDRFIPITKKPRMTKEEEYMAMIIFS